MSKKWWLLLVVVIVIILIVAVGMFALKETKAPVVGGDKDSHGCIGSAGYSWCESINKCYRPWEETCQSAGTFAEEGNLAKPSANGPWVLVFEKPGQPALSVGLIFDKDSVCMATGVQMDCNQLGARLNGIRTQVQGTIEGKNVRVKKLSLLQGLM